MTVEGGTRPASEQSVGKIQDPIIKSICSELGSLQPTTVYDAKSSLSIEPYKSVAQALNSTKMTCQGYLDSSTDPRQESLKTDLQAQLHDLEEKRIEVTRQLERDKLAHQEGNVLLRELAEKKSELSDKINTIHNELELFDKHLKDLSFKNKKLTATLKEIQAEEETCERELNQLDKEKAELAQRLAEVTQVAHAKQKFISQLCARRQTVVESLQKMHVDAQEFQKVATELDLRRRKLNEQYCELADEENNTDARLRALDQQRRKRYGELEGTTEAINETQQKVIYNLPVPPVPPEVEHVNAIPLDHVPTADKTITTKPLNIPPHSFLPDGYSSGPRMAFGAITSNAIVGGKIPPGQARGIPVFNAKAIGVPEEYYNPHLQFRKAPPPAKSKLALEASGEREGGEERNPLFDSTYKRSFEKK